MSLHKIPDKIAEKYRLEDPGSIVVLAGKTPISIERKRLEKTPFTGYSLIYKNDGVYVDVPDGKDDIASA